MKDEFGYLFLFSGKQAVTAYTAEGEPSTCIHGASRAARATCTSSVHCSLSGQSRGVDAVEDEDNDEVHGTEAVISFSLKCLKVGMGR